MARGVGGRLGRTVGCSPGIPANPAAAGRSPANPGAGDRLGTAAGRTLGTAAGREPGVGGVVC